METNTNKNKRIARNTIYLYIRMLFVLVVNLFTSRVILRTLGVVDYGVYNVVAGFVSMFSFLNTSMSNGIQRYYNFALGKNERDGVQKVFITAITIQFTIMLLMLILVETIGIWYLETEMVIPDDRMNAARFVFQVSVVSLSIVMMQIPYSALIMAYEKMDYYAFVGVLDVLLKLGIVYMIPLFGSDNLVTYGTLLLGVTILNFILYSGYTKKHFKGLKYKFVFYKDLFKSMFQFSGWNVLGTFAFMLKGQGLNMVLNVFFGPVVNAARGIASQVMSALQGFSSNMVIAFRPQIVQSYAAGEYSRVKNIFYSESKISYILLYILVIPVVLEIDYILGLWLGKDIVPEWTVSFTILVLANMLVNTFHTPLTQVVHATGKMKKYQLAIFFIICSIVPISYFVLKLGFGPNSAFIVSLILCFINVFVSLLIVHSLFPFSYKEYFRKVIVPCLGISILLPIIPLIVRLLMPSSFLRLVIVGVLDVAWAFVLLYGFILDKEEKKIIQGFVKKFYSK